jgi:hypothetical protein
MVYLGSISMVSIVSKCKQCYECPGYLFDSTIPCPECILGDKVRLDQKKQELLYHKDRVKYLNKSIKTLKNKLES